ncbi:Serine/threonine-protein kinase PknB [Crateriforma conspicua]|uniref:non-specific serine/threonine protein kinase n=1 Tax=Crateriforma conspicua TaxID=2527996 RepID=A0A5C5XS95_9PLAN|nr:serine/threonine-protein kinase [Crateriforma conspicua]TWT65509.1 Serine/threonine-protein kinase PknB [Crateriforma conspicua]
MNRQADRDAAQDRPDNDGTAPSSGQHPSSVVPVATEDLNRPRSETQEQRLADVLGRLTDQVCRGEIVDFDRACRENSDIADDLRHLWGAVLITDTAGAAHDQNPAVADGSDSDAGGGVSRWRSLQLPTTVGDYELIEEVGRGGMGVVFRARQISLEREVAVKMILRGRLASDADLQRFLAEASATARLDHPGIVPVYEVGDIDGRPFFSMKFVAGKTLAQRIKSGPMPQREAARIVADVARAVAYAHRQGVLHRDVKPSNILLGNDGNARITDFGLAKQTGAKVDLTRSGMLLGTPAYMSPEQAGGRTSSVGPTSDIYSLGCVLYYALTGRAPFVADSPMDLVMQVIEQDPLPPRALRPRVNRDLEMIVIRCLQKPMDLRYESADALADDLEAFLADEHVNASSGRFSQVLARLFRETHHAAVLENWGLLWMWHSLVLMVACTLTWWMEYVGVTDRFSYVGVWVVGLGAWAAVFWKMRQRMGPVTFIERQIAHVWGSSMIAIGLLFPLEWWLKLPVLTLSPMLGVISAMVFIIKAGMLTGAFYCQAVALLIASVAMAAWPNWSHLIFGVVSAGCFFFPGLKYWRRRKH